jgi:PAS domain S-box-containing protein
MKSPVDSESSAGHPTEGPELAAFQAFMRHLPGAWWIKDAAGRYVDANGAVEGILGTERERLLGSTDFDLLPMAAAAALRAHDEHVLRTGQSLEVIEQLPSSNGLTRSWFSCKFLLPSGAARYTAGFAIEISQITEERRNAEGTLQQILDAISDMVLVKGPNSRLEWANAAFLATYGMTNEQLKGLIDAPYSEPDLTQKYVQDDHYVFTTGHSLEIPEEPMVRHDGKVLTCHTVKSPIFDGSGKVSKTVAVIRDITERKRLELDLGQAQKLESVGRLASGIAHEINTPIQFVGDQARFLRDTFQDLMTLCQEYRSFVAKCEQGGVSPEDVSSVRRAEADADLEFVMDNVPLAFDAIAEGTARVGNLVRAMKEFGHPDRGEKTATDLNRALENTVTISSNETKFVADVSLDLGVLPEVTCYPGELNQVFLNLLVNAAHSIGEAIAGSARRGKITITTRHVDAHVIVSIGDTGMGIPEALRAKIFEAFFTTKEVGRGTGQGLAIARMIVVEKHQGTLTFESELGVGTTFHVKIPVNSPQPTG